MTKTQTDSIYDHRRDPPGCCLCKWDVSNNKKRRSLALYRFVCQIFGIKKMEPKHMKEKRIQDLRESNGNEHVVAVMKSRRITG